MLIDTKTLKENLSLLYLPFPFKVKHVTNVHWAANKFTYFDTKYTFHSFIDGPNGISGLYDRQPPESGAAGVVPFLSDGL
jgi:hypothetical protein